MADEPEWPERCALVKIYPRWGLAIASSKVFCVLFRFIKEKVQNMRIVSLILVLLSSAGQAFAHIGHIGQIADHGHIAAGIAIGLTGAIALIKILKDLNNKAEDLEEEIQEV